MSNEEINSNDSEERPIQVNELIICGMFIWHIRIYFEEMGQRKMLFFILLGDSENEELNEYFLLFFDEDFIYSKNKNIFILTKAKWKS